jgi:methyltransferase
MPPVASAPTLVIFGLLLVQRLGEVVLSARHVRTSRARHGAPLDADGANKLHELALYGVHACFFALPIVEAYLRGWPAPLLPLWLGVLLLVLAQVVRLWTMRTLGVGWRIPAVAFEGDPIVAHGPYAHVRHPNHAAVLLEFLVAPLLAGAPLAWVVLNVAHTPFVLARVRREERALELVGPYAARLGARPLFLPRPRSLSGALSALRSTRTNDRCN